MKRREDPTRDPASEARDDWADHELNDWRRRDRDPWDTEDHERFLLGLDPVGYMPLPTQTDDQETDEQA